MAEEVTRSQLQPAPTCCPPAKATWQLLGNRLQAMPAAGWRQGAALARPVQKALDREEQEVSSANHASKLTCPRCGTSAPSRYPSGPVKRVQQQAGHQATSIKMAGTVGICKGSRRLGRVMWCLLAGYTMQPLPNECMDHQTARHLQKRIPADKAFSSEKWHFGSEPREGSPHHWGATPAARAPQASSASFLHMK